METWLCEYPCNLFMWFKSYYVVWKPQYDLNKISNIKCLNRTMQYGNYMDF